MMKAVIRTILILGTLILYSCTDNEPVPKIESQFIFSIEERHEYQLEAPPVMYLSMETVEILPCENYQILVDKTLNDKVLTLDIKDISIGSICLTAIGPATYSTKLDESVERLRIIKGDTTDLYDLEINGTSVSITPVRTSYTKSENLLVNRFPENSFACVCGTQEEFPDICDDFRDELNNRLNLGQFYFPDGAIPYPDSSSGNWINTASTFYTYPTKDTYIQAGQLLEDFTNQYLTQNSGVSIHLMSWDNKHFRSWD